MARTVAEFDTLQITYDDNEYSPHVGIYSEDTPYEFAPWRWDERMWGAENYENLDSTVPCLWDPTTSYLPEEYFQSGVADSRIDCEVLQVNSDRRASKDTWGVEAWHGQYFRFQEVRQLYATRGHHLHVDTADNVTTVAGDHNELVLDWEPRQNANISAIMWRRDADGKTRVHRRCQQVVDFTGDWSGGVQLETRKTDSHIIDWANVDLSAREFIVDMWSGIQTRWIPTKLVFNKDHSLLVGETTATTVDELELCEYIGESDGTDNQIFNTRFFPILDNDELVMFVNDGGSIETWTRQLAGGTHYYGMQQGLTFTVTPFTAPDGYFVIDFDRGEIMFPAGGAPAASADIYLCYRATLEVSYEPDYIARTAPPGVLETGNNTTMSLPVHVDVNPFHTNINQGFVYISEEDNRVASLQLTIEGKSLITGATYGPVSIGTDYCYVVATALNRAGSPVSGAMIDFYFPGIGDKDWGRLAGKLNHGMARTDSNGEARIVYMAPRSVNSIATYASKGAGDYLEIDDFEYLTLDEIYTYQVLSTDPLQPYDGTANDRGGAKIVIYEWDATAIHPRSGAAGAFVPTRPISYTSNQLEYDTGVLSAAGGGLECYWVIAEKDIPIQASCFSSLYQHDLDSNVVDVRLTLPDHMKGVYVAAGIGTIPYGFRFYDDNFEAASALDGATFLSINTTVGSLPLMWPYLGSFERVGEFEDAYPWTGRQGLTITVT